MRARSVSRLLTSSALLVAARLFGAAAMFAVQGLIAHWLGATQLGFFALATSAASVLAIVCALGFPSIAARFIAESRVGSRHDLLRGFLASGRLHLVVCSGLLVMLLLPVEWLAAGRLDPGLRTALAIGILSAPVLALMRFNGAVANAFRREMLGFLPEIVARPVLLLAVVLALSSAAAGGSAAFLMAINLGLLTMLAAVQGLLLARHVERTAPGADVAVEHGAWRRAALPMVPVAIVTSLVVDLDILLVGLLVEADDVAVFSICLRIGAFVTFGLQAISQLFLPDLSERYARGDRAGVEAVVRWINAASLALTLAATLAAILFGDDLLRLFGDDFAIGYAALVLTALVQVVRAAAGPGAQLLVSGGLQAASLPVFGVGLAVLAVLNVALIPPFGLTGAGVALLLSTSVWSIWMSALVRRRLGYDVSVMALIPESWTRPRRGPERGVPALGGTAMDGRGAETGGR